jgi:Tfp pilus assembly protein FimT
LPFNVEQMKRPAVQSRCAGFSVFEVLPVTAIAAILMSVAAPQLPVYWAQFQLVGSARQIGVELQRTRMKAVGENSFYRIIFNGEGTYVRQSSSDGVTFVSDAGPMSLPSGIRFVSTAGGLPQPTFNGLGTLQADATVTLTNLSGRTKVVQMNTVGRVSISAG